MRIKEVKETYYFCLIQYGAFDNVIKANEEYKKGIGGGVGYVDGYFIRQVIEAEKQLTSFNTLVSEKYPRIRLDDSKSNEYILDRMYKLYDSLAIEVLRGNYIDESKGTIQLDKEFETLPKEFVDFVKTSMVIPTFFKVRYYNKMDEELKKSYDKYIHKLNLISNRFEKYDIFKAI